MLTKSNRKKGDALMVHVVLRVIQMDHAVLMVHVHAIRNNLNKHHQKFNYRAYLSKF